MIAVLASTQLTPVAKQWASNRRNTQGQPDVVPLCAGRAALAPLHPGALLEPPVVVLDGPGELGELQPG